MEKTFKERLNSLVGDLSRNAFARKCGIKQTTMNGYLNGKFEPRVEDLIKIANTCGRSVGWLAAGEEGDSPQEALLSNYPNREANARFGELMGKTAQIVTSKTIYRSALERNIDAFYKAVEAEDEMFGVKDELAALRKENRDMAERMERMEKILLSLGGAAPEKRDKAADA